MATIVSTTCISFEAPETGYADDPWEHRNESMQTLNERRAQIARGQSGKVYWGDRGVTHLLDAQPTGAPAGASVTIWGPAVKPRRA